MNVSAIEIANCLGGRKTVGRRIRTLRELDNLVREGLPRTSLDKLIDELALYPSAPSANELRYKIIPRATYQRSETLNTQTSETVERLARIYSIVLSVFEDETATRKFMLSDHPELDNRTPFDTALTEIGGREVEHLVEKGLHGLPV